MSPTERLERSRVAARPQPRTQPPAAHRGECSSRTRAELTDTATTSASATEGRPCFFITPLTNSRRAPRTMALTRATHASTHTQSTHSEVSGSRGFAKPSRVVLLATRHPATSGGSCLYSSYEESGAGRRTPPARTPRSPAAVRPRRGTAAPPGRAAAPVPASRGRPRRPHRRSGRAPALCPSCLALDVRVLHRGAPPLRSRGLLAHRRGAGLARARCCSRCWRTADCT